MTQVSMNLTFGQDQMHKKILWVALPLCQIWKKLVKHFSNYLNWNFSKKFFKILLTGRQTTTFSWMITMCQNTSKNIFLCYSIWPKWLWPWPRSKSNYPKNEKITKTTYHILDAISLTHIFTSVITAFCDSFGRCPLVTHFGGNLTLTWYHDWITSH